ncbi:helix-turn-helix transcriptional regulator [Hyphococcus flavus]|uniref:Helix-turn-helix transcriptional regulator n=1 Tax=Hyphococcus flavus TaxID=1866326 RepID=A0AAE9ZCI0_9PROT|nr:helix-turn-helix transcriptional regulator [Hyphococcus flavus]WDI30033.1 helix-turn-helix transcriptional regulator [Hyphococcus flavus]
MELTHAAATRSIGDRIRQARKTKGMSQSDLASRVGVSQPAIANWESGIHDPRRLTLAKLADALEAPLDWLAAGDRSAAESDKHAAAAYIRRPVRHVPVVSLRTAALLARDPGADPHAMAEDYIPVTLGPSKLVAVFINDPAIDLAFLPDTVVIVDYEDKMPDDGDYCLIHVEETPLVRRWKSNPARLEPVSSQDGHPTIAFTPSVTIIGCVRVSIRVH